MNRTGINSSGLNGPSGLAAILAFASIVCTADVSALGVRQWDAIAPSTSSGSLIAEAVVTRNPVANLSATGSLYAVPTVNRATFANIEGSSEVLAYVLSTVVAHADITGSAEIQANVANEIGAATLTGTASVSPKLTVITFGFSNVVVSGDTEVTAEPLVTRYVIANPGGTANVRAEPAVNGVQGAYSDVVSSANLVGVATATTMQGASVVCSASVSALGTQEQPGYATVFNNGSVVIADLGVTVVATTHVLCSAEVTASITRIINAVALLNSAADIEVINTYVNHAAHVNTYLGSCSIAASGQVTQSMFAAIPCSATVLANATRIASTTVSISSPANIVANVTRTTYSESVVEGTATLDAEGTRNLIGECEVLAAAELVATITCTQYAEVTFAASAEIDFILDEIVVTKLPEANIDASAEVTGALTYTAMPTSDVLCTAEVYADTIANPESIDPDERTFFSPSRLVDFSRSFIETEFRRAA